MLIVSITVKYIKVTARKHTYHRENCDCLIRETVVDIWGRTIYLAGRHAFEWSIIVCTRERIVKTTYPNGREARKEFYKYKKKRSDGFIHILISRLTTKPTLSLYHI